MAGGLAGSDLARLLNCAAEKEQFFGNGRLARIGVTDNGKGAAAFYFLLVMLFHNLLPLSLAAAFRQFRKPFQSEQNNGEENSSPHIDNAIYAEKGQ